MTMHDRPEPSDGELSATRAYAQLSEPDQETDEIESFPPTKQGASDLDDAAMADLLQRIARLTRRPLPNTQPPAPAPTVELEALPALPQQAEESAEDAAHLSPPQEEAPEATPEAAAPPIAEVGSPPPADPERPTSPFLLTPAAMPDEALLRETNKHLKTLGAVNILIAGQTGVGKSTLVNAVFGEAFAPTASGRPVTLQPEWYESDTVPLRILDTQGLEAKHYAATLAAIKTEIEESRAQPDDRKHLHMAWVCIATPSSRIQDCEIDIVRMLNHHRIPAVLVLTKDDEDDEFANVVARIMREQSAEVAAIVPVRALAKPRRPATGLGNLVLATYRALPAAHRAAFAASQKVNRDLNRSTADDYVTAAASAAAAAAVVPVPFADLATLAPIQASMLVGISNAFGVTLERSQIRQLVTTVLGCLALTMAGGWAIGTILKFIPGPGTLIGAVLNAGLAGGLTRMLGKAYIRFLVTFLETHGRLPSPEEIFEVFPKFLRTAQKDAVAR